MISAIKAVLPLVGSSDKVGAVMVGTTHFLNAVIQRKEALLQKVLLPHVFILISNESGVFCSTQWDSFIRPPSFL